jgi:adenosylmethionine-8-amino-7-oxononanoate aminotransferase
MSILIRFSVIDRGEGVYLYDLEGKRYLDAISSWWVNLFGHCNPRINAALQRQAARLEQVVFANFSHQPAIELAERIVQVTPEGLEKVFFADNGSSAVEVALKLSFQYHQQAGNVAKTKFVAITDAYHGETLGALSVGDLDLYNRIFKPILFNTYKVTGPDCFRCGYQQCRRSCNTECFGTMEKLLVEKYDEICAVIIEPLLQAAAGMKMYPPLYLKKLRELCSQYEVHLIADEIAAGFGRTGTMFACEQAAISPDLLCLSKGLTAG